MHGQAPLSDTPTARRVVARYLEAKGTGKGWEKRRENDDFAEQNVPEELVLLWRKNKSMFRGTPHRRVELFMEWVEENPDENTFLQNQDAEEFMRKHEQSEKKENLCRERCPTCYTEEPF